jgi:hypothetical protein
MGKKSVTVELKAEPFSLGSPDFDFPGLNDDEWLVLIAKARAHFQSRRKQGHAVPKKSERIDYFLTLRLSDGSPVSKNQAEMLATAMVGMQKGGNT